MVHSSHGCEGFLHADVFIILATINTSLQAPVQVQAAKVQEVYSSHEQKTWLRYNWASS
jgi:hypothetical protein